MKDYLYWYKAYVTSVYDGDTCTVELDLGYDFHRKKHKVRLYGIDTPELRGSEREQGLISRDYLRHLVLEKEILLESIRDKTGKYGRYLGKLWFENEDGEWVCANDLLIKDGYATEY